MFPNQVNPSSGEHLTATRPSMPTPDQSPRGSLPFDEQDNHSNETSKQDITNERKSTLPLDFFSHSSPPLPISPLSSFRAQDSPQSTTASPCTSSPSSRHRRSISMDRDIRKKLQQMKMTPASSPPVAEECDAQQQDLLPKAKRANSMQKPLGRHKLSLNNFILEKTVGTGSFGRVHLAQGRTTGRFYAIKALRKQDLVDKRQVEHANNERVILRSVDHPFVVKLWDTFQDEGHVFFVMDYVPGGELFRILRRNKSFSESAARFYAAEVLLAIDYLHSLDIAYRDIKPENILLDAQGHIKLADFGFSKKVTDLTWTVCGTPDYLAPEIIRSQGYTKAVDWWSFGVLIYEMVMGEAPFQAENPVDKYQMILDCNIKFLPNRMSDDLMDLLRNLLKVKPTERYGNLKNGVDDIKCHPWFKKIDFVKLANGQIKPPWIPDVKHAGDSSCFQTYTEHPNTPYGSIVGDDTDDDDDTYQSSDAGDPFSGF